MSELDQAPETPEGTWSLISMCIHGNAAKRLNFITCANRKLSFQGANIEVEAAGHISWIGSTVADLPLQLMKRDNNIDIILHVIETLCSGVITVQPA